jgi:phosphoribosylglycinamide formyltransferase 1
MFLPRYVVLLSGNGSTLQNFIDKIAGGLLPGQIVGVVSSKAGVYGLERAKLAGIPTAVAKDPFPVLEAWKPDLVLCAGWMRMLKVPKEYTGRVLNIHPSLLPAFGGQGMYGHHVHEAVIAAKCTESGCTVHFVDDTYDTGPVILQRTVPVLPSDTPLTLAEKVQAAEREAYPEAIRLVLGGLASSPALV